MLTTGAIVFFSAVVGNFSQSWLIATGHYRGRMIEYGVWAGGAFVIGLGVLPVVAALAGLVRPKDEERTPALRAFTALLLAALLCFGLYTAVKASYLSTSFGTVIVERNLIYLVPLVFVGTALWLERPRLRGSRWRPRPASSPTCSCRPTTRSRTSRTRTRSASRSRRCRTATSRSRTTRCSGR